MSAAEAEALGVAGSERRSLVRLDSAKVNNAPPASETSWFRLIGVQLGNGTPEYSRGDEVQTAEPWQPPLSLSISPADENRILDQIAAGLPNGQRYSRSPQATKRAALTIVRETVPNLTIPQAKAVIANWFKKGVIGVQKYHDPIERRKRDGLYVNPAKRAEWMRVNQIV